LVRPADICTLGTECCDAPLLSYQGDIFSGSDLLPVSCLTVLGVDCSSSFVLYQRILASLFDALARLARRSGGVGRVAAAADIVRMRMDCCGPMSGVLLVSGGGGIYSSASAVLILRSVHLLYVYSAPDRWFSIGYISMSSCLRYHTSVDTRLITGDMLLFVDGR